MCFYSEALWMLTCSVKGFTKFAVAAKLYHYIASCNRIALLLAHMEVCVCVCVCVCVMLFFRGLNEVSRSDFVWLIITNVRMYKGAYRCAAPLTHCASVLVWRLTGLAAATLPQRQRVKHAGNQKPLSFGVNIENECQVKMTSLCSWLSSAHYIADGFIYDALECEILFLNSHQWIASHATLLWNMIT